MNPVHTFPPYFPKIHSNIILPPSAGFPSGVFPICIPPLVWQRKDECIHDFVWWGGGGGVSEGPGTWPHRMLQNKRIMMETGYWAGSGFGYCNVERTISTRELVFCVAFLVSLNPGILIHVKAECYESIIMNPWYKRVRLRQNKAPCVLQLHYFDVIAFVHAALSIIAFM
jgi:hypothetical protein